MKLLCGQIIKDLLGDEMDVSGFCTIACWYFLGLCKLCSI